MKLKAKLKLLKQIERRNAERIKAYVKKDSKQ